MIVCLQEKPNQANFPGKQSWKHLASCCYTMLLGQQLTSSTSTNNGIPIVLPVYQPVVNKLFAALIPHLIQLRDTSRGDDLFFPLIRHYIMVYCHMMSFRGFVFFIVLFFRESRSHGFLILFFFFFAKPHLLKGKCRQVSSVCP